MQPIYIVEQGAKVRARNQCILIERSGEDPSSESVQVPIGTISQLVLFGNISITTPAIALLLEKDIDVAFLTQTGKFRGRLYNGSGAQVSLRRAQYRALEDPNCVLTVATRFVEAKLSHQKALLQRHNRELGSLTIVKSIQMIDTMLKRLALKENMNSLRGLEGKAAAAYFEGYRQLFQPEWKFERRAKRPSPDAINAMLSFGYTLLAQLAVGATEVVGLDPYAGFLHVQSYNRQSLGLDIMEEFRPVVDGVVLWCCRGGQIVPGDFEEIDDLEYPCVMNQKAKKIFIQAFEKRMKSNFTHPVTQTKLSIKQCMIEQTRQLARWLLALPKPFSFQLMGFR